jgi:sugar phosphate isomerase/epimerase
MGRTASLDGRLGLSVPSAWWPTAPMLKAFEAAGFAWVQVHTPPAEMLRDPGAAERHATALRATLDTCGLRLILHGPDTLSAGTPETDRAFEGLAAYARDTRAEFVVYHGANFPVARDGEDREIALERARREEHSLRRMLGCIESSGATFAIENLAPVYPGPPRLCHDPRFVRDLARRLASERVGVLFDLGHAHIAAELEGSDAMSFHDEVSDDVVLFHVHDNLGARRGDAPEHPGIDPLRLDLHLPPGAGRVPWDRFAPRLLGHDAPLLLEIHPPHRPEPLSIARVTTEVLSASSSPSAAAAGVAVNAPSAGAA